MRFDSVRLEPENTDLEFRLTDEKIYIDLGKAFKKTATDLRPIEIFDQTEKRNLFC